MTHGHLDHVGRLPLLVKLGYREPVFATAATIKITGVVMVLLGSVLVGITIALGG